MHRLAYILDRDVITANGSCSSKDWGAHSGGGWLFTKKPTAEERKNNKDELVAQGLVAEKLQP